MRSLALCFLLTAFSLRARDLPALEVTASGESSENAFGLRLEMEDLTFTASQGGNYQDLFAQIPGAYAGNPVGGTFSLRGIGQDTVFSYLNSGSNPLIAVFEDGIPLSAYILRHLPPPLWNLAGVEVLQGPQIHLPGPASSSGALLFEPTAASPDGHGKGFVETGEYGLLRGGIAQDFTLLRDELALRIAAYHEEADGDETNRYDADDRYGATSRERVEGRLRWVPGGAAGSIVDFSMLWDQSRGNPVALVRESGRDGLFARKTSADSPYDYPADRLAAVIHAFVPLPGGIRLDSTTGFQRLDLGQTRDLDNSVALHWYTSGFVDERRFTQHVLLAGEKEQVEWQAGFYLERSDYDTRNAGMGGLPPPFGLPVDSRAFEDVWIGAMDGRVDWELIKRWHLIGGLRLNREKRELAASSISGGAPRNSEVTDDALLPQLGAEWRPDNRAATGLRISRPYRAAGISYAASLGAVQPYAAEDGWEVEWYAKARLESLLLSASVFHSRLRDLQVPYTPPGGYPGIDTLVANSGRARRDGAELEARWQAHPMVSLFANLAWTRQRFDELSIGAADHSGQAFPNAPEWTAGLGGEFHHPGGLFGSLVFSYADSTYSGADYPAATRLEPRQLLSCKMGYAWKQARVYLFGSNLLNDDYAQLRLGNPGTGVSTLGKTGPPRTIGLGFGIDW